MTNRDELLDQYIDAVNAGQSPARDTNDAELSSLYQLVDALQVLREPTWPNAEFAGDMANALASQLAPVSNGRFAITSETPDVSAVVAVPRQDEEPADRLKAFPPATSPWRAFAKVSGALAAVAIFALILSLVFRDAGGSNSLPGVAPSMQEGVGQLAFAADYNGNSDIYLVEADGSNLIRLTDGTSMDLLPVWSPDGTEIAFVSDRNGQPQIFIMASDGSDVRQLTHGPEPTGWPAWSPDGQKIAGARGEGVTNNDDIMELYVVNADGSDGRTLTPDHGPIAGFTWSPDSKEIAASVGLSGRGHQILAYMADGSDVRNLQATEDRQINPVWSPDGQFLVFGRGEQVSSSSDGFRFNVAVMDSSGEQLRPISDSLSTASQPAWSPDSQFIAVAGSSTSSETGIFIVANGNPDDLQYVESTSANDFYPVWSPDGGRIAFFRATTEDSDAQSLMVVNADGTGLVTVASDLTTLTIPAWRPTSSVSGERQPTVTIPPDETPEPTLTPELSVRDPAAVPMLLASGAEQVEGVVGHHGWIDDETETFLSGGSSLIDIGSDSLTVEPGAELEVTLAFSGETQPALTASVYTWEDNNAHPDDPGHSTDDSSWFASKTAPISEFVLDAADPRFTAPVDADRYVVVVSARWPVDEQNRRDFAINLFTLYVSDSPSEDEAEPLSVGDAIDMVSELIDAPAAQLDGQIGRTEVLVMQRVPNSNMTGEYRVNRETGEVVAGTNPLATSMHATVNQVDEEAAINIAQEFMIDRLGVTASTDRPEATSYGVVGTDVTFSTTWIDGGIDNTDNSSRAIDITVNLQTGLVYAWETRDQQTPGMPDTSSAEPEEQPPSDISDELISKGDVFNVLSEILGEVEPGITLTLSETPTGDWIYEGQRTVDGVVDSFIVDAHSGDILNLNLVSNMQSIGQQEPIEIDIIRGTAENYAGQLVPQIEDMHLYAERVEQEQGNSNVYRAIWMLRHESTGAWLPTRVELSVNLETGLLHTFAQNTRQYQEPTDPEILEQDAITLAREVAESQFPSEATRQVEKVELVAVLVLAGSRAPDDPQTDVHRLTWRVYLDGMAMIPIDAVSGEPVR